MNAEKKNSENDLKVIQTALKDQDEIPPNSHRDYYARHFIVHQTGDLRKRYKDTSPC